MTHKDLHDEATGGDIGNGVPAAVFTSPGGEAAAAEVKVPAKKAATTKRATAKKAPAKKAPAKKSANNDKPETVDAEVVYVWLTEVEREGSELPGRVKATDMWVSLADAMSTDKEKRVEDARWLVKANGMTRKVEGTVW